jgi:hypothetical protein
MSAVFYFLAVVAGFVLGLAVAALFRANDDG